MSRCTHVYQESSEGCFAACLQSFLFDSNQSVGTQTEMVDRCKAEGLCDDKGVVPDHNMEKFCALFGIDSKKIENRKIPHGEIAEGAGILIACWNYDSTGQSHCVRFCAWIGEEKFRVMNPAPRREEDKFPEVETRQIDGWKCDIFSIRLKESSPKAEA